MLSIAALVAIVFVVGNAMVKDLRQSALRAEAKLMLLYIQRLENVHFIDEGTYAFWPEEYGTDLNAEPACSRPEGAQKLGFVLRKCGNQPEDGGPLYTYRVESGESNQGFVAYATSGRDRQGRDLVCLSADRQDIWRVSKSGEPVHVRQCE